MPLFRFPTLRFLALALLCAAPFLVPQPGHAQAAAGPHPVEIHDAGRLLGPI